MYLLVCDQPHKYWYEYVYHPYAAHSPHNSKHLFDIYSWTHVWWCLFLMVSVRRIFPKIDPLTIALGMFIFTTLFEIYENQQKQIQQYRRIEVDSTGKTFYRGDSVINVIGDIIWNLIGIYLGYRITNNLQIAAILSFTFFIVTRIVGFSYWTDFLKFTWLFAKTP